MMSCLREHIPEAFILFRWGIDMKKTSLLLLITLLLPLYIFCDTTEVVIEGFKGDAQQNSGVYLFPKIWDPSNNDMSVASSSEVDINARGASGDGLLAFTWVLYGNYYNKATVSFEVSPMTFVNEHDEVNYLPFTLTFVCGNTMISHFTVPYNSTPISNSSFTVRENQTTYTFKYSDFITKITAGENTINSPSSLSAAKASLSWTVNPRAGTHTGNQTFSVEYALSTKSTVSIGNTVITSSGSYPTLCNQWNRAGSVYIKIDTNANAGYTIGGTVYTAVSGVYTSTIIVRCSGV